MSAFVLAITEIATRLIATSKAKISPSLCVSGGLIGFSVLVGLSRIKNGLVAVFRRTANGISMHKMAGANGTALLVPLPKVAASVMAALRVVTKL